MLLALRPVAIVPIKPADPQIHRSARLDKCIYVCQALKLGGRRGSSLTLCETSAYCSKMTELEPRYRAHGPVLPRLVSRTAFHCNGQSVGSGVLRSALGVIKSHRFAFLQRVHGSPAGLIRQERLLLPLQLVCILQMKARMSSARLSSFNHCSWYRVTGKRPTGCMRYKLMPVRGWRILFAKDLAWLLIVAALVIGLSPLAGLTGAFVALAVGHHASVRRPVRQQRWRFTSGLLFPVGLVQVAAMFAAGTAVERLSLWFLPGSFALCVSSMFLYGFIWDRYTD